LEIAEHYASLATQEPLQHPVAWRIQEEFRRSVQVVCLLTEREELLDQTPWLKESIRVRNRFIDPLNLIQVELMRRASQLKSDDETIEEHRHLMRLTINGIAAGMRTSG
jgi:phosphoenolpyruvate carboxylase